MRVHSVRTELHNLRLWEIEGCAQIYASVLHCINRQAVFGEGSVLHSAFPVQGFAVTTHTHTRSAGHCGLYCWSHKPGCHVEGAVVVVIIYKTMLSRAVVPA